MSKKFKIIKDYYEEDFNLYNKSCVTFNPGLTVVIGCNGSGKTTLLKQLRLQLEKEDAALCYFDNYKDGGHAARDKACFFGDMDFVIAGFGASEGENITLNLNNVVKECGRLHKEYPDAKEQWILLDGIDSGYSIDNILEFKSFFNDLIYEYNKGIDTYVIVTANEFELASGENCFDIHNLKYCKMGSYDKYKKYILKSREIKDKRDSSAE